MPTIFKNEPCDQSGRGQNTSLGWFKKFTVLDGLNLSELVYNGLIALPSFIVITSDAPKWFFFPETPKLNLKFSLKPKTETKNKVYLQVPQTPK